MKKTLLQIVFSCFVFGLMGQTEEAEKLETQPWAKKFLEKLDVGGYYRLIYNDRLLTNPYDGIGGERQISVIDPTYFDPMLFLYVGGSPLPGTSFGAELRVDNPLLGASKDQLSTFALFNGLVLRGSVQTKKAGNFVGSFGGIEWINVSPFTFGGNTGFNRFSIFERRPWDPGGNVIGRPSSYYYTNDINQDVRFGTNAFKGVLLDVYDLPENLTAKILYGNSQNFNGFDRESQVAPRKVYGAKLERKIKKGTVGISTYNTIAYQDSVNRDFDTRRIFRMIEGYANLDFKDKFSVFSELGYGTNNDPEQDATSGSAFLVDFKTKEQWTKVPISVRGYRFGKYFINPDSYIENTTTTPFLQNLFQQNPGANLPNTARLTTAGDLVNNRIGGNLSVDIPIGKLKLLTSLDVSKDLERFSETNVITYVHRINGLEISQLVPFPNATGNFGPNDRVGTFFRGAFETVNLSDTADDGGIRSELYYTSVDVQLKYKTKIANKDLYLFNLNTISAVNNKASYDNAYILASYHEFEAYYHLWRDISLAAYYGYEIVQGNSQTDQEIQEDGESKGRDQVGQTLGLGIDYQLNDKTFFYLRQRWFDFKDKNFAGEKFAGTRLSFEMKIFF